METGRQGPDLPFEAKAAVSQFHAVKHNSSNGEVSHTTDHADGAIGIAMRPATAGNPVEVRVYGAAMAKLGAAATRGALLRPTTNSGGDAGKLSPASAADDRVIAVALESGAKDDLIRVILAHGQIK